MLAPSTQRYSPMRVVRAIHADEVVATFLRGDLESFRFGGRLRALLETDGVDPAVVAEPDVDDHEANEYRRGLLGRHHEWLAGPHVFGDFPESLDWSRALLAPDEVLEVRYINWDWWLTISVGTRSPVEAAKRIRAGRVPGGNPDEDELIARRLISPNPPPELIVVSTPDNSRLVVVEGHMRLTSYALFPDYLPDELEILLGVSPKIVDWTLF
jgi:hypothetical protein